MTITDRSINQHFADTHPPQASTQDYSGAIVALLAAFAMGFITCLITIGVVLS